MNWLGRRWVHASPERSRWRSISPCIRVKRNAESTAAFRPENLTTRPTPAFFGRVDEGALGFRHSWVSRRDQQNSVDAVQCRAEGLGQQHVALDEFHNRNFI